MLNLDKCPPAFCLAVARKHGVHIFACLLVTATLLHVLVLLPSFREVDEQLLEFQLSVSFGKYLFYQYDPLPYKYTVFSPVAEKKDEVYELLHDYDGQTNRSLIVLRKDLELYSKKGVCIIIIE